MSDYDLDLARQILARPMETDKERTVGCAIATARAAVDAAETARARHTTLEGILQAVDSMESLLHDIRGPISVPAPDAPATPQEGEVWQQGDRFPSRVRVDRHMHANVWACTALHNLPSQQGHHGYIWRAGDEVFCLLTVPADGWRHVSPAPAPLTEQPITAADLAREVEAAGRILAHGGDWSATVKPPPLTEREVTAEVAKPACDPAPDAKYEAEDLPWAPATDEMIEQWTGEAKGYPNAEWKPLAVGRLIARVRAAEARAEQAEAEVERMRQVLATADRFEKGNVSWPVFSATVRAYREATRDA